MARFRSKKTEIEAQQFDADHPHQFVHFIGVDPLTGKKMFKVDSAQGWVRVNMGDWIIKEPNGKGHYPCAPDVFAAKYEPIEAPANGGETR